MNQLVGVNFEKAKESKCGNVVTVATLKGAGVWVT